ncbi:50S ribosomal protein L32 [bacterium]|nr:50S ribosomal protein L32 [bacterium]|tara:strand:- start:1208 stop:1414 length:207 start_codon:yes stop_codon:yes gene_type:complete
MAVPKKRRSKAKKRTHRSLWKISSPETQTCKQCGELTLLHHACTHCGYYKGKHVLKIKIKEEKTNKES